MGKAHQIADLEKENNAFQEFMKNLENDMTVNSQTYLDAFDKEIQDFYKASYSDVVTVEAKNHRDYQFETEFSTKRIAEIISQTSKEVFDEQSDDEKKEIVTALGSYKEMATNIAIHFLSNVLASLTWGQTAEYRYNIQHISVGPGLTLHMLIVEKYYDGETFFNKKKIIQNYIIYKLAFSRELAGVQADIEFLTNRLNEVQNNEKVYNMIHEKWMNLIVSEEYIEECDDYTAPKHMLEKSYQRILDQLSISRDVAYNEISKLIKKQETSNAVSDAIGKVQIRESIAPNTRLLNYLNTHSK